jgi:hypothetical protein
MPRLWATRGRKSASVLIEAVGKREVWEPSQAMTTSICRIDSQAIKPVSITFVLLVGRQPGLGRAGR